MKRALLLVVAAIIAGAEAPPEPLPNYDVEGYCRSAAKEMGNSQYMEHACLEQEQSAYDALKLTWSSLPPQTQTYCDRAAREMGQSYFMLKACVQQEQNAAQQNSHFKFQR